MNNFNNLGFIKTLENPVTPHSNSSNFLKELPIPSQSFNNILQDQLNNPSYSGELFGEVSRHDPYNNDIASTEKPIYEKYDLKTTDKTEKNEEITDKENPSGVSKDINYLNNEKDNIHNISNNQNEKTDDKSELAGADKTHKDVQDSALRTKKTNNKEKASEIEDPSLLLKEINYILNMIKGAPFEKRQIQEIKSVLSELKNSLITKNDNPDKNIITQNSLELKKMLEKLKSLIETANERSGIKRLNFDNKDVIAKTEKSGDIRDIEDLKKQISKLIEDLKQNINHKKTENIFSKIEDVNENKNLNVQKVLQENTSADKSENAQAKDNSSGFNFSSQRKEVESTGSSLHKGNAAGTERRNAFEDQLDAVMQNARIVVRDSKNGSFSIRLQPESLGTVNVNLNLEQGVIMGRFLVDSAEAKEVLLENMQSVIERLQDNGISVGEFNVNVRENKSSFSGFREDALPHIINHKEPVTAGNEYEINSHYMHDGAIDLII
ncbi:MAG: flagellar hook-length control protein FliK [Spirochaetota bacterium]